MDVMRHRAGLSYTDDGNPNTDDLLPLFDPSATNSTQQIAEVIARSKANYVRAEETRTAYHGITRGLILNEVVRRADSRGRTIGQLLQEEMIPRWPGVEFHIGLKNSGGREKEESLFSQIHSDSVMWRLRVIGGILARFIVGDVLGWCDPLPSIPHNISRFLWEDVLSGSILSSPLVRSGETIKGARIFAMPELHATDYARWVESPSSNGMSNARSMAAIMNDVLRMGEQEDPLLCNVTRKRFFQHDTKADYDIAIHANVIYTDGGLARFHEDFGPFNGFYGWAGMGGSFMLLDPVSDVAVAYATTRMETLSPWDDPRTHHIFRCLRHIISL